MCYTVERQKEMNLLKQKTVIVDVYRRMPIWRMNIMKKMNRITALVVAGIISCTSPMMVMASDSGSIMSQVEEVLKDNEVESLAADPDKVSILLFM